MTRASDLVTLGPEDSVDAAIRHMAERHLNQLPVVADGRLVGMIARVNVLRFMEIKDLSESDRR
jgi:predicted transcriptional regulator